MGYIETNVGVGATLGTYVNSIYFDGVLSIQDTNRSRLRPDEIRTVLHGAPSAPYEAGLRTLTAPFTSGVHNLTLVMDAHHTAAAYLSYSQEALGELYRHNSYTVEIYFAEANGGCPDDPPAPAADARLRTLALAATGSVTPGINTTGAGGGATMRLPLLTPPSFSPIVYNYTAAPLAFTDNNVFSFHVELMNTAASVQVLLYMADGRLVTAATAARRRLMSHETTTLGPVTVPLGESKVVLRVRAVDQVASVDYEFRFTRYGVAAHAQLSSLALTAGAALSAPFASARFEYTCTVDASVTSIRLTPTPTRADASVYVDGRLLPINGTSRAIALVSTLHPP
jgi:hypothetical protein